MSRKRKNPGKPFNNNSGSHPSNMPENGFITPYGCAISNSGEDLREALSELVQSQWHIINYLRITGLSETLCDELKGEIHPLAQQIAIATNSSMDYIKTFLLDGLTLREAIQLATGLKKLDILEDDQLRDGMYKRFQA